MTIQEATKALRDGKAIRHRYFLPSEWVKLSSDKRRYEFEDGVKLSPDQFWLDRMGVAWETDWEIVENPKSI